MATPPSARLSASEGRRFAWTLAPAFGALSAIAYWRGHALATIIFAAGAVVTFVAGLVAPSRLGRVRAGWMAVGVAISRVVSPVVFTGVYLLILTPIAIVRRTAGHSPLARRKDARTFWLRRAASNEDDARRAMEHQF